MDEGDEYVPQMSQIGDYGMPPMGQQHYQQALPPNPYEQQHMMMMQQNAMGMGQAPVQQAPPPQAAPAPPAKKPRGKSKKAQAAAAAQEAAAAAAAAQNQMDPMASMAAMSNNPMMRPNGYQNQMGMYGGGYPGGSQQAQQGYRPGPAGAPQTQQGQYPPQNYPPQMYHQQQRPPGPGYPPQYGYPPGPGGYPPPQSQYPPPQMRPQYPQGGQQAPPGYWDQQQQQQQQYPGYGNNPAASTPASGPSSSNAQQAGGQGQMPPGSAPVDQWGRPQHAGPHQVQASSEQMKYQLYNIEAEMNKTQSRLNQFMHQPRNPMVEQEISHLQMRMHCLQKDHYMISQQVHHQSYQMAPGSSNQMQQNAGPSSVGSNHQPSSQKSIPQTPTPQQMAPSGSAGSTPHVFPGQGPPSNVPPSSGQGPPVQVNQTGNQVQFNITADNSRTLISVYHEGYNSSNSNQVPTSGMDSGASSTESKESVVPPEPTPTGMQHQIASSTQNQIADSIKQEDVKPNVGALQNNQFCGPPGGGGFNGMENGTNKMGQNGPQNYPQTSQSQQGMHQNPMGNQTVPSGAASGGYPQQQQMYGGGAQYPGQAMSGYPPQPHQQHPHQQQPPHPQQHQQLNNPYTSMHQPPPQHAPHPSQIPQPPTGGMMPNGGGGVSGNGQIPQHQQQMRNPMMNPPPTSGNNFAPFPFSSQPSSTSFGENGRFDANCGPAPSQGMPPPSSGSAQPTVSTPMSERDMLEMKQCEEAATTITIKPSSSHSDNFPAEPKEPIESMIEDSDSQLTTMSQQEMEERATNDEINRIMANEDTVGKDDLEGMNVPTPSITREEVERPVEADNFNESADMSNGTVVETEVKAEEQPEEARIQEEKPQIQENGSYGQNVLEQAIPEATLPVQESSSFEPVLEATPMEESFENVTEPVKEEAIPTVEEAEKIIAEEIQPETSYNTNMDYENSCEDLNVPIAEPSIEEEAVSAESAPEPAAVEVEMKEEAVPVSESIPQVEARQQIQEDEPVPSTSFDNVVKATEESIPAPESPVPPKKEKSPSPIAENTQKVEAEVKQFEEPMQSEYPEGGVVDHEEEIGGEQFDENKDEEDSASTVTSKTATDDMKEGSEEPTPSETNDGFTEPSAPATPMTTASTASSSTATVKKRSYKRPVIIAKAKKKKSADDSDDDLDFMPERGRGRKKGGKKKNKNEVAEEDEESFQTESVLKRAASGKWADVLNAPEEEDDDDTMMRVESTADPDAMIVEKILNFRMNKEGEGEEAEEKEQFLIKWKGRAYVHCEWKTIEELEELDKRSVAKVKRFKIKKSQERGIEDDEDFNADYVIVDRVVDVTKEEDGQEFALIKWKSLGYEEVTWEAIETIPEEKVELWRKRQVVDSAKLKEKPRPEPSEWKKIEDTMTWNNGNTLREYQFEGVNWLLYCYHNAQNCILADEMGLGKTVQTITFLSQIYEYGIHGPFLIVVPLSTIHNWVREFETWTDMNAVVYHGSAYAREVLQQHEIYYDKKHSAKNFKKNVVKLDALITTFEMVVTDCEFIKKIPWRVCVIDEAHRLKNRNCKLLVNGLLAFRMEHRVLLTGTPLQNNIEELFSLLNFLHPQQFNSSTEFLEQFGQCQSDDQVQKLQEILRPMMLRRLKEDVEKSLGPKEETIIEVQLSDMQKKFYRAILERNFTHLCKGASAPSLMNVMMELRKCCNHPFLINGAEETILNEYKMMHPEWDEETLNMKALVQSSGKVVLIEKLLPKLRKDGHKVLIFSQMVRVLDLLEEFLVNMNYPFERIDGNVRGDLRQASIDRFSRENSDRFVFLLCTRAGGLGINLTAADTVIIFDSDWNPQNDLQAQARCHRIGQKKLVKVYRLITANTYEREMFDKASLKLGLDKAVLQSTTALKESSTALSKKDVEELLKKGAYGSIMDEENDSAKFNEEDIETILQRRTQTITLEAGQKGSLFAKASFNSTHNKGDDIDIDDPEFWNKWAEKAQVDIEKATATPDGRELIIEEPRKRTKRFEDNMKDDEDSDGSENSGKRKRNGPAGTARKRRKDDDDGDYSSNYRPDELATSKTEYFKVEKVLAQFGWGRWAEMKKNGDLEMSEMDIEHMSRTLLLHCIREFRGEDRVRQFIFNLIKPEGVNTNKDAAKQGQQMVSAYHQGWAALPEFNPPSFALDSSFQRHVHRHANKLMIKIDMLKHLELIIIGDVKGLVDDETKKWNEITLKEVPAVAEAFVDGWDVDCDKCLLIGSWRHGLENYESLKNDETLCFAEKNIPNWPSPSELWGRFKKLLTTSQRNVHDPVYERLKWTRREEQEFMRVLRSFGIKDSKVDSSKIDWESFRSFAPVLEKKSDEECQEQLFCVLAMCTKAQGGDLAPMDLKRAMSVEPMNARKAFRLMNRLHLTRKVHALAVQLDSPNMNLCAMDAMPSGWTTQHDKELMEICDQYGIDGLVSNVARKPAFEKIVRPSERTLLRRVIEVVNTVEAGKWMGAGDVDTIEDSDSEEKRELSNQQQQLRIQQQQQAAAAAAATAALAASTAAANAASARRSRKRAANDKENANMRALMQQMVLASGAGGAGTSQQSQNDLAAAALLQHILMPQLVGSGNSASTSAQQAAQVQLLAHMLLGQGLPPAQAASTSTSKQQSSSSASASTASATAVLAQAAAASAAAESAATLTSTSQMTLQQQLALAEILAASQGATMQPQSQPSTSTATPTVKKQKSITAGTIKANEPSTSNASSSGATASTSAASVASAAAAANATAAAASNAAVQAQQNAMLKQAHEQMVLQHLTSAGIGMHELVMLNRLPQDTPIPMINRRTREALPDAERPAMKDLTVWLLSNTDYALDLQMAGKKPKPPPLQSQPSTSSLPNAAGSTPSSAKPSAPPTPAPVITPATPKAASPKVEEKKTPSATANVKVGGTLQIDDPVAVFNRNTGELLPASKWPKPKDLTSWLDANPECNIHSSSAVMAQLVLGNIPKYRSRIAGDQAISTAPSTSHTPAPPLTPSTPASMSAATNAQLAALAAASMATPTTSTATAVATKAAAKAAATAQFNADALAKQQIEAIQMQLMLQQMVMQQQATQAMMFGFPSTSTAPTLTSTPTTSSNTKQPSSSTGATSSADDLMNPMLMQALLTNPLLVQSMMVDPTIAMMLTGQMPGTSSSSNPGQGSSKKSKH